jgi:hypothetical protein
MNIRDEILKEHSKENALRIAEYACTSKNNFAELMICFFAGENVVAQRAAYSVNKAVKLKPLMVQPYLKEIIKQLSRKDVHGAIIRSSVNILEMIDIPEEFHGEVLNACFGFIENPATDIAVKAASLTVLFNLMKIYPDIKHELKLLITERWDMETAAFKSRGRKILNLMQAN